VVRALALALGLWAGASATARAAEDGQNGAPDDGSHGGDRHVIRVLTMGPGPHPFESFGHNAVEVVERRTGEATVYNYGTFRVTRNVVLTFVRGQLEFWLATTSHDQMLRDYQGRDVFSQELELPPGMADELALRLRVNALPEHRAYLYDHFRDNCSTRIRDHLDRLLGGVIRKHVGDRPGTRTLRGNVDSFLGPKPFLRMGLQFALSKNVDRPSTRWDEMFLPSRLQTALSQIQLVHPDGQHRPLVKSETQLLRGVPRPDRSIFWAVGALGLTLLPLALGVVLLRLGRRRDRDGLHRAGSAVAGVGVAVYGLCTGLAGTLIGSIWLTRLDDGHANGNLVYATPLHMLLLPVGLLLASGKLTYSTARAAVAFLGFCLLCMQLDLAAHAVGLGTQRHLWFGFYFGIATLLCLRAFQLWRRRRWR
jgi:hypothetical protein